MTKKKKKKKNLHGLLIPNPIKYKHLSLICIYLLIYVFSFGHAYGMQKFPGQGLNPSHRSDNAESLTTRPPGNSLSLVFNRLCKNIPNIIY